MPDLALDLRYLRYALLVAEQGSLRRAAEILNLSQSTVSRRLQILERRLGVALFERTRNGTKPTIAGDRFLRDAEVGARHLEQAVSSISLAKQGVVGELRIGFMASLATGYLSTVLEFFHQRFPMIDVVLEEATSQTSAAGVLSGRFDIAFLPGAPNLPGCQSELLWNERILVALPDAHRLADCSHIAWESVREETFLVTADVTGPEVEDYLVRQLSGAGFRPRVSVQRVGREAILNLVGLGFGLTLTTESTLGASYRGVRFVTVAPEDIVSSSAVWSSGNLNPAVDRLLEICREATGGPQPHVGTRPAPRVLS